MPTAARRDDLLEQIRALPLEDRDYIEAALMREAYEQGRRTDSPDELDEIKQRAVDALSGRNPSYSREESVARARRSRSDSYAEAVKDFHVEAIAQTEFDEAAGWYETQREGLGLELIAEIDRVLVRIAHDETFPTAPIATVEGGVVASSSNDSRTSSCSSRRMTSAG